MANHRKVYLEITNRCNFSCVFCPGTDRTPGILGKDDFTRLAERVSPWAEFLYYHLMGEPTAHPLLLEFMSIASGLGLKSIITTNCTLLGQRGESIISANPHKVNISLHAFEANTAVEDNGLIRNMSFDEYIGGYPSRRIPCSPQEGRLPHS